MAKSPATERVIDKSEPTPVASPASTKRRDHDKAPTASKPAYNSETRDATSRPYIIERVSLNRTQRSKSSSVSMRLSIRACISCPWSCAS